MEKDAETTISIVCQTERPFFRCPDNKMDLAVELLDCAKHDQDACKLLYANRIFALAVFHLQQAFEKTLKAEMLLSGYYSIKDLKRFRHNVIDATKDFKRRMATHFNWKPDDSLQMMYDHFLKNRKRIQWQDCDSLQRILMAVQETRGDWTEALKMKGLDEHTIRSSWATYFEINILALLTAYHESTTRYPDTGEGELKPSDYIEGLGIVAAIPDIQLELEYIIGYLERHCIHTKHKQRKREIS